MTLKKSDDVAAAMTRRNFLERFGMVGGSTLVMSAMHRGNCSARRQVARPSLAGRPKNARVIVLGAGISGMTAGYELSKLGYDVKILEARDRVGGVNWTVRKGATHTELGPAARHRSAPSTKGCT